MDGQPQQNGTAPPGASELLSGPGPASRAAARIRAGRAETLAALEKGELGDGKPAVPSADAASKPTPTRVEPDETDPVEGDAAEDSAGDFDIDNRTAKAADEKTDPETAKRLAAVQNAEKRSREKIAAARAEVDTARAELEKERAAIEAERAELAAYKKARERAKVDPVSLLEAVGVDDLEYAAKQAYAKAKADPNNKEAAARMMREREYADELAALRKRLDERDQMDQERQQNEVIRREAESYMADVAKAAGLGEISPLAKHFMTKSPERTNLKLRQIAVDLLNETGDRPDVEDVLARYEKTRRAELEELGVDPISILAPSQKKNDQTADKKNSAKTLANDLSAPRVPRPKTSEREHRAETLAMLESGKLE